MKPVNTQALYKILNTLNIEGQTTDFTHYKVPDDKLLLLRYVGEIGPAILRIADVMIQDGAGGNGDKELIELFGDNGEIVMDMFLDDDTNDLKSNLQLIDNPFPKF